MEIDWDKAPEGCTHCNIHQVGPKWWSKDGQIMREYANGKWHERLYWPKNLIPRPAKPSAPVWDGEGRPPAGVECEINLYGYWFAATVLAYGKTRFIYEISPGQVDDEGELISGESDGFLHRAKFRPIRTKEQREREEIVWPAYDYLAENYNFEIDTVLDLVYGLYDAGLLLKPERN